MNSSARALVIERGVALEDVISKMLCFLLDIEDDENSHSFGYRSSALSLSSKINLLNDLKFLPENIKKDLQLFLEIRNKFAHLSAVDSFSSCLTYLSTNKNRFLSRYPNPNETIDEEIKYKVCFSILCFELKTFLEIITELIHHKKSQDLKKTGVVEVVREFLKVHTNIDEIENEHVSNLLKFIKPLIDEITPDEDFILDKQNLI